MTDNIITARMKQLGINSSTDPGRINLPLRREEQVEKASLESQGRKGKRSAAITSRQHSPAI